MMEDQTTYRTNTPTNMDKLAEALAAFQSEIPKIDLDAKVTVKTKTGGSYQFEYATLQNIMRKTLPILTKHGLAVSQIFDGSHLKTTLMHKSGQSINSTIPVDVSTGTMQEIGSRISYMRRYQLSPLLGIVAEADDDANIADGNTYQKQAKKQPPKATEKPQDKQTPIDLYLGTMKKARETLKKITGSDEVYYQALKIYGIEHANEMRDLKEGEELIKDLRKFAKREKEKNDKNAATGKAPGDDGSSFPPEES